MHHFKAFDMINLQYEIKIWKKILNKATIDKKQHPPPLLSTLRLFLILFEYWVLEVEIPLVKLLYWPSVNFPCCTFTFWKNCKHTIIHTQFKVDSNIVQSSLVKTRFQKLVATHNNSNAKALEIKYIMHNGLFTLLFSYRKGLLISLVTLSCARKQIRNKQGPSQTCLYFA